MASVVGGEEPSEAGVITAAAAPSEHPRLKPLSPQRYGLQVTLDERTHGLLREAQDLLAHTEGGRQISHVLTRALDLLVKHLKQRRFAETERPRKSSGKKKSKSNRHVPANVKRAVNKRDEGRCTYRNDEGERCPARSHLEYDDIVPKGRGGRPTVDNLRLRCRAHNQLAAEQIYGEEFMRQKREAAKRAVDDRKAAARGAKKSTDAGRMAASRLMPAAEGGPRRDPEAVDAGQRAALSEKAFEVIPWLRQHSMPAPDAS